VRPRRSHTTEAVRTVQPLGELPNGPQRVGQKSLRERRQSTEYESHGKDHGRGDNAMERGGSSTPPPVQGPCFRKLIPAEEGPIRRVSGSRHPEHRPTT